MSRQVRYLVDTAESLFRPYDAVGPHERSDLEEKVLSINPVISGLMDYWIDYYGMFRCQSDELTCRSRWLVAGPLSGEGMYVPSDVQSRRF